MNRFHEAAREGHLDLLRDATRRDANKPDDTGRTPPMWAAYEGKADALRLLMSRGGDPDLCDHQGYTALHYAALSGHINTLTFLVSYGCNIWAMTNDYRTAKDLAAENNHLKCLGFLDEESAEKSAKNSRMVKKMKEKAFVEADKRIKKLKKMQADHEKWLEKEEKKRQKEGGGKKPGSLYVKKAAAGKKDGPASPVESLAQRNSSGTTFSEITSANSTQSGRKPHSKSPLTINSQQSDDARSRSTRSSLSDRGEGQEIDEEEEEGDPRPDIRKPGFWRPINGSGLVHAVQSLPPSKPGQGDDALEDDLLEDAVAIEHDFRKLSVDDQAPNSALTPNSDLSPTDQNANELDWDPDDLDNDEEDDLQAISDLEFFLSVNNLLDYLPVFTREEIDLQALMLLLDEDFVKLGLPLGPRRKLTDAISRRRKAMNTPGVMADTPL